MLGAIRVKERDDLLGSSLVKLAPTEFVLSCALLRGERQDLVGKRYGGVKPERLDAVGFRADQYASSDHEGQQIAMVRTGGTPRAALFRSISVMWRSRAA